MPAVNVTKSLPWLKVSKSTWKQFISRVERIPALTVIMLQAEQTC